MKKIKEIIKKLNKSQKKSIIGGISCFLLAMILINLGVSLADPSSGTNYLNDQVVDGLSFEKATLNYENGISEYQVEVHNDQASSYSLKTISIVFKDIEGKEITTMVGYIGEVLTSNETKYLQASIDQEIPNISQIVYSIQK